MEQKSIKKNTIYNAIKTGASILFPVITFPYISRVLLAENIGKINFGKSIVSYISLIASLGINTYAIRECSKVRKDKDKLENIASQIFSINIVTTIVAYLMLVGILVFCKKLENYRTLIIIQSLSVLAVTMGADWLNSAMEDYKFITVRTLAFQFLSLLLMLIFVRKTDDYMKYAVISLVSGAGANVVNIWHRKRYCRVGFISNLIKGIDWKRHFIPIMYMFVMILAQTIFNSVDSTMLGLMHGDRDVGIYSSAHYITSVINQFVGSLAWVIMPRISCYFAENDYKKVNALLRKVLGFYITIGFPCAIGMVMLSDDIILLLLGNDFLDASPVLRIMMIGFLISLYGGNFLGNTILIPSKREKYYMIACCIMALFNVVANFFLIPKLGARGAAITTSICSLLMLAMLETRKNRNIKIDNCWNVFAPPVVGCLCIVMICLVCRRIEQIWIRVIVSVACSALVYFVSQIVFKNSFVVDVCKDAVVFLKKKR